MDKLKAMAKTSVCSLRKSIKTSAKSMSNRISSKIGDHYKNIKDTGTNGIKKIKEMKKKGLDAVENAGDVAYDKTAGKYLKHPLRKTRPDLTLLLEIVVVIAIIIILYKALPYFTGTVKPGFSKAQFQKALNLPPSAFTVQQLAQVNIESNAFKAYGDFFKEARSPYSWKNSGMPDLMMASILMPFIVITFQFIVPPFVIGYIMWFIYHYWKYVYSGTIAWITMLYNYFTTLLQCRFGCKWYVRMMTGWGCCSPRFSDYVNGWRKEYVDKPIYYEKLKYFRKYYWAKKHYYEIPYRKYISIPSKKYKVKVNFAKKMYIDRALEVFLSKLLGSYPKTYVKPRDRFYTMLLSSNKNLAAAYAKTKQAKAQIEGKSYKSITPNGKMCVCPATKTPLSQIKKAIKTESGNAKDDLITLIDETKKAYNKLNQIPDLDCDTVDNIIENRRSIGGTMLLVTGIIVFALIGYSTLYGTPFWLLNMVGPTTGYAIKGLSTVNKGVSYLSWTWVYLLIAISSMVAVTFS
jgi:hypothetical protein